jgi:signal transduction histidine kinase
MGSVVQTKEQIITELANQPMPTSGAREPERCQAEPEGILAGLWQPINFIPCQVNKDNGLGIIIDKFMANLDADYASLSVRDEATGKYFLKSRAGNVKASWEKLCQDLPKAIVPTLYNASKDDPELGRLLTSAGVSAVLYVPIAIEGEATGTLYVIRATGKAIFTASDLDFASILGKLSSPIIENTELSIKCDQQRLQMDILLREMSSAYEAERKRVASEIHDTVAQWMVGASYSIRVCGALISAARFGELEQELNKVENVLHMSIKELRRVIANLRTSPLKQLGFAGALHQMAETLSEEGITCHIDIDPRLPKLDTHEETTTYLIIQEALNNVRKHSQATGVNLSVHCQDNTIAVEISDDGEGFDMNEVMNSTVVLEHIGLQSMKERVEMLGGYLSIESKPSKGTSLAFTFPVSCPIPCLVQI